MSVGEELVGFCDDDDDVSPTNCIRPWYLTAKESAALSKSVRTRTMACWGDNEDDDEEAIVGVEMGAGGNIS